ncbi:hypothetical protein Tco_0568252 [Tanacetum coccineum]
METYSCEFYGGSPHLGFDCQTQNMPVYEQGPCYNQNFGYEQPSYYSPSSPQQFYCCEFCGGPHFGSDCHTRNPFVYESEFERLSKLLKIEIDRLQEELIRTQMPNPLVDLEKPKESDDDTEVIFVEEQFLRQQSTAHVTPPPLTYIPPLPCLSSMDPSDTLSMGDEVISITPVSENDKFIRSNIDDLVPIPKDSEVTLVNNDLECSMPIDTPSFPCTNVSGDESLDIDLPFGEDLDTLLMRDREITLLGM